VIRFRLLAGVAPNAGGENNARQRLVMLGLRLAGRCCGVGGGGGYIWPD